MAKKIKTRRAFGTPNQLGLTTRICFFSLGQKGPDILMIIATKALLLPM